MTVRKDELQEEVHKRWEAGESYDKLGAEYHVSPRTIQRWVKGDNTPRKPRQSIEPPAPAGPVISLKDLLRDTGDLAAARQWQFVIDLAAERGNPLPARFTARLSIFEDSLSIDGIAVVAGDGPWRAATAGFPLLGESLGCPAFGAIAQVMADSKPWEGRVQRRAYHKAAVRLLANLRRELMAWALSGLPGAPPEVSAAIAQRLPHGGVPAYIMAIVKRLPDIDRGGMFQGQIDMAWAILTILALQVNSRRETK